MLVMYLSEFNACGMSRTLDDCTIHIGNGTLYDKQPLHTKQMKPNEEIWFTYHYEGRIAVQVLMHTERATSLNNIH